MSTPTLQSHPVEAPPPPYSIDPPPHTDQPDSLPIYTSQDVDGDARSRKKSKDKKYEFLHFSACDCNINSLTIGRAPGAVRLLKSAAWGVLWFIGFS